MRKTLKNILKGFYAMFKLTIVAGFFCAWGGLVLSNTVTYYLHDWWPVIPKMNFADGFWIFVGVLVLKLLTSLFSVNRDK